MALKRGYMFSFLVLLVLIAVPVASAGFFSDFWGRITGEATQGTSDLNITVGNAAPVIKFVEAITPKTPVDDTNITVTFNFTATDDDGAANINVSTAQANFTRGTEVNRYNLSCDNWSSSGNDVNFTCSVRMAFYDENGAWSVNASIKDINDDYGENTTNTFTYNSLLAMKISPTALTWTGVGLSSTNVGSNNDPITINNTGNDINLNINVTALDLQGEVTTTQYIFAENFTVENASEGCSGTVMVNASSINITSAILQRGNHELGNGQEDIFFCLKGVPQDASSQSYSSAVLGAWTVKVVT